MVMLTNMKKSNFGWVLVLALSLFPVILWLLSSPFSSRFNGFAGSAASFGQVFGLVGAAMFAVNLILSTRLRFVEKIFFGLNRVYYRHSQLGQVAFMLLLFHPLFLLPKYAGGSFFQAALFLLPGSNWPINFGWLALAGMILLIVATLYLPLRYNFWKVTHKFLGLFFFFASLHIWLIPSDVSSYLPLRVYMLGLSMLGLSAYVYHTLLGKFFTKKLHYVVKSVRLLNDNVVNIVMEPLGPELRFKPGQFVFVSFKGKGISRESHPFSITSSPGEKNISITTKKLGDYTDKLDKVPVEAMAEVEGPFGVFSYTLAKNNRQIWIAGGIGITPFVSMAKSLKPNGDYDIDLYYCLRNEREAVYLEDLKNIAQALRGGFKIIPFYSDAEGFINADVIERESEKLNDKDIFICAPPPMIASLKAQFLAKGISKKLIYSEEFAFN